MAGFLGKFRHQFDAKGRISLPASFRRGHETTPFVLLHARPEALSLYPEPRWLEKEKELLEMMTRSPEYRPMVLHLTSMAQELSLDSQGRINVPDRLREGAGLGSEALIVGAIDKIELWNPERFESQTAPTSEEFRDQSGRIFA